MMTSKLASLFGLILFVCSSNALAATATVSPLTEMPVEARQAVSIWNLNFKPFAMENFTNEVQDLFSDLAREAPMRVIADYNGDGVEDYALLGEAVGQQYLIVVVSGKKWSVVEVEKWSSVKFKKTMIVGMKDKAPGVPFYIVKASGSLADSYALKHKREALQLEAYLGSVTLYSINGKKARELRP